MVLLVCLSVSFLGRVPDGQTLLGNWRAAVRAAAPVDDLGLVDLVAGVLGGGQARGGSDRAVDVNETTARPADQVVVIVADSVLVPGGGPGGLDAAQKPLVGEQADGVVNGPPRDRADLGRHDLDHLVGGGVRPGGDRAQHGDPLGRHLEPVLPQQLCRFDNHNYTLGAEFADVQINEDPREDAQVGRAVGCPPVRVLAGAIAVIVVTSGLVPASAPSIVGPADAAIQAERVELPAWEPPLPEGSEHCPPAGRGAVIDRDAQRAWLCTDGTAHPKFPITTALNQPDPGTYKVYAKDRVTTSTFGGHFSYLDNFVAFARGKFTGARVAFHAVPRTAGGRPYQPYDTLGTPEWHGASSGCIRVLPDQSQLIWNHLTVGDPVRVIT